MASSKDDEALTESDSDRAQAGTRYLFSVGFSRTVVAFNPFTAMVGHLPNRHQLREKKLCDLDGLDRRSSWLDSLHSRPPETDPYRNSNQR